METTEIIIGFAALLLVAFVLISYVKAPPSVAFIISGLSKAPRVLIGKGGFRVPFFERIDKVYLGQMSVDIKTSEAVPTQDFINVNIDAVAKVRVMPTPDGIRLAAANFLNMTDTEIQLQLKDSLEGNMREIIGTLDLKKLNTDRDSFSDQIADKAKKDMEKLGIEILSCNIQNVTDEQNLIRDLGADNTYKIKKDASITKANAEKEIAIAQSIAAKDANEAHVQAETAIAERNNDLSIRRSDLKKESDARKAMADAAYEITKQEQLKVINAKTIDAKIEQTKREQVLSEEQIKIRENQLTAEVAKVAEAGKYQTEQNAEAAKYKQEAEAAAELEMRKRKAEAEAYEAEQKAKAVKATAEAKKYEMEQEANGIEAQGRAEAAKILAIGQAEAEALRLKAEAYQKYNGTIKLQEAIVGVLPEVAKNVAAPLSQIKDITIYGTGSEAANVTGNIPVVTKQVRDVMKSATGVDVADMLRSETIQARTDKNVKIDGLETVIAK